MFTAAEIGAMPDRELATYASGGYGPEKRAKMIASVRRLALAETSHRAQVEQAKGEIRGLFGRSRNPRRIGSVTLTICTISSIAYASEDTGADAPCIFVWSDGRTETRSKSWTGFFRGVEGGRNGAGDECEWRDGTGMEATQSVVAAFGSSISAYVPPPPPDPPQDPAP